MADFATAHADKPGSFLSSNTLTVEQDALLRHYSYTSVAISVLDEFRKDVLTRLTRNEIPVQLADKIAVEWATMQPPPPTT